MKKILRILSISCIIFLGEKVRAQCPGGYTQATLNWDNLDYYYKTTAAPYGDGSGGTYISNAMEQTQKFGVGTTYVTFATSAAGIVKGQNKTNTCDIASYTGSDAQFTPTAANQTITLTFATDVQNVMFTLYGVDKSAVIHIDALNSASVAQNVGVTLQGTTILTTTNNNSTNTFITASNTTIPNNDNRGTATISTANNVLVRSIKLTVTTLGGNPTFWFSKMYACVSGTFPINYHQIAAAKPFTGQPDYFLLTPDNQSVYMVDPATGKAWFIFTDASQPYVNSLAYDPVNHVLYYVTDGTASPSTNKQLKKYDFNTNTSSVVLADITTSLNIPTFDQGVESAGAAFYNGILYLGIEGGNYNSSNTRWSIVYRLDLNAGGTPISAEQVFATPAYSNITGNSIHDWGDFIVKDGKIIDFNTARQGSFPTYTYPSSSYIHFDMMTGLTTTYTNPTPSQVYAGQAGLDWAGNLYSFWWDPNISSGGLKKYNMAGGIGANTNITVVTGPVWPGGSGDAAGPFKPQMDFGDAPASYDPAGSDPAVNEIDANLHLGANVDREWVTRGQTILANSDNFDDAVSTVGIFNPAYSQYLIQASVYNNTGANATVCAWLDYNGNGKFDVGEGLTPITVPTSASQQSIWLYWPSCPSVLVNGSYTYMRIRITYASNGMTASNPTGYYNSGEVEDYRVPVNSYPLAVQSYNFDALLVSSKTVKLSWNTIDDTNIDSYVIEKSTNSIDWQLVKGVESKMISGMQTYEGMDNSVLPGFSYYRLKILSKDGKVQLSTTKKIENKFDKLSLSITPNPAINKSNLYINYGNIATKQATVEVINGQGAIVYKEQIQIITGTNSFELPIEKLSSGRYMVRVTTDNDNNSQTLIINR